jgi:hypothetical protein
VVGVGVRGNRDVDRVDATLAQQSNYVYASSRVNQCHLAFGRAYDNGVTLTNVEEREFDVFVGLPMIGIYCTNDADCE